jgi:hypothetical protein
MMYTAARDFIENPAQFDKAGAFDLAAIRGHAEAEIAAAEEMPPLDPPDPADPNPANS